MTPQNRSVNQSSKNRFELEFMTRDEAAEALQHFDTAVLPLGATEQHGPHLPMGTDTYLAHGMAKQLAKEIDALVLPAMPVGYSWVWRDIPGNIAISVDTTKAIIKDIAHSMQRYGMKRMVVISGHGANDSAMKYAVRELADEIPIRIYHFTYPGVKEAAAKYAQSPMWHGMIHACELETSWLLAVRPDLVDMSKAVREYPETPKSHLYHHSSLPMGALSESGVFGDATLATQEKGEKMLAEIVAYMASIVTSTKDIEI